MKKYNTYKDSGIEWIGEIPEHWDSIMIKRLSTVKRGASPRPIADPKYFDKNGQYAWVRIADVSASDRYLENTTQMLSELGASLSVKREPGHFFLSIAGTVGKPIITKIKCCIHDGFVYFPDLKINPEYLYYIFSTGLPYQGLGKLGTQLNLNTETVGEIVIPIPKEIEEIVEFLDKKTTEIDELIADKEALLKLYEEEKAAVINDLVTGKKVWNGNAWTEPVEVKDSGIEWLDDASTGSARGIPEHWEVKKFKYFFDLITEKSEIELKKIGLENIESKTGRFIETNSNFEGIGVKFTVNDILFGKLRPYLAKVCIADFEGQAVGDFYVFRGKGFVIPNFAKYKILDSSFINITNSSTYGSKMPRVSWEFIANLFIAFPPIEEQKNIVEHIESETDRIDAKIENTKKLIDLLKEYRTALISEVVTGKVKVV